MSCMAQMDTYEAGVSQRIYGHIERMEGIGQMFLHLKMTWKML